jgi:hypothetical protein
MRNDSREIALGHLKKAWDHINKCIEKGTANTDEQEYDYHRTIFLKAWDYIEGWDRKYNKDGILMSEMEREDA